MCIYTYPAHTLSHFQLRIQPIWPSVRQPPRKKQRANSICAIRLVNRLLNVRAPPVEQVQCNTLHHCATRRPAFAATHTMASYSFYHTAHFCVLLSVGDSSIFLYPTPCPPFWGLDCSAPQKSPGFFFVYVSFTEYSGVAVYRDHLFFPSQPSSLEYTWAAP